MRKSGFFPRLALVNLARNGRFYGPYLLSCVVTAAMYYILLFLAYNEGLDSVRGAMYLKSFAGVGCFVAAGLSAVILLYANSFVMKRRQRELGLYNVLGLEKRHIARMCLWEALFCAVAGYSVQFIISLCSELGFRICGLSSPEYFLLQLAITAAVLPLVYLRFGRKLKRGQNMDLDRRSLLPLVVGAVLAEVVLC